MKRNYPEIRIKDAWLLRENASKFLHELWGKDQELADDALMEKRVAEYEAAWKPYEAKIMNGMCEVVGLEFRQNIIDVYIAPWFAAFSDPLVIGIQNDPDTFVDVLTHELLHRLLTDNTSIDFQTGSLAKEWPKLFGEEHEFGVLVHIPVQAIHKHLYLEVLKEPKRLEREIENYKKETSYDPANYLKAWDYIDQHGYKEIIAKLKASYKELAIQ
ncbi:MAG: hypothetical protein KIH63_003185 [Candidatus Saccharibacteria bacterium]|nr:hypothetical protein [Candidatus Saccharibacteria bacterium]